MSDVLVPLPRMPRWVENFSGRHGGVRLAVVDGLLTGDAPNGAWFRAVQPFDRTYDGAPDAAAFAAAGAPPDDWGVLLVRKGGFAVAALAGDRVVGSKVGRRHVQGRTKAGGQSQQRFARRRGNQARAAYEAAADHAARVLDGVTRVVVGGDRSAVAAVLADPRLGGLVTMGPWLAVPDPRRDVLDAAVADACAAQVSVENPA